MDSDTQHASNRGTRRWLVVSVLGVLTAAVPAVLRGYDALEWVAEFPVYWISGVAIGAALIHLIVAAGPWDDAAASHALKRFVLGFGVATILLVILGIGSTGDWIRFALFQSGLESLEPLSGTQLASAQFYY
ncbi:hypothetical protein [Acidisphaera sp. L21]|uniref:hypothetical protein n=1 Tax=Acidisphaera sp. L21 TaxID=1641851 RepID=UPI00131D5CBB|nr:hypothetical protein [Acidisphaera sp. L21]